MKNKHMQIKWKINRYNKKYEELMQRIESEFIDLSLKSVL